MQSSSHSISKESIKSFADLIASNTRFVICSHENPDADAYGSSAGLGIALRAAGKEVFFMNASPTLERLNFIPFASETDSSLPEGFEPDAFIICDCGAFQRVGESVYRQIASDPGKPVLNIDHHISNDFFGTINIVVPNASSTSEIICALLSETGMQISSDCASALYAGILADSGSFRYSCVRPYTFEAASLCVSKGAVPHKISELMFSNNSMAQTKLHAKALLEMTLHISGRVALIVTSAKMIAECGASVSDSDGLAEEGRDIEGVQVSVLMKEDFNHSHKDETGKPLKIWRISMRSKSERYDVSALAQKFGGGGHKAAAAFRSSKPQPEIKTALLAELELMFAGHQ